MNLNYLCLTLPPRSPASTTLNWCFQARTSMERAKRCICGRSKEVRRYWGQSTRTCYQRANNLNSVFSKQDKYEEVEAMHLRALNGRTDSKEGNYGRMSLRLAEEIGHEAVVKKLVLDTGKVDADSKDRNYCPPGGFAPLLRQRRPVFPCISNPSCENPRVCVCPLRFPYPPRRHL